jgi:hypothetical protein
MSGTFDHYDPLMTKADWLPEQSRTNVSRTVVHYDPVLTKADRKVLKSKENT